MKSGLSSLLAGKITSKQQNLKTKTLSYNCSIKKLAVKEENTMVAHVQLHNMRQDRDEMIRSFHARLRYQASVCKFLIKCPGCDADVNYSENILCDIVTCGLTDSEIQLDLLGEKKQDMTLEEVFQFIEAKEAGKRSAGHLLETQGADATCSQYRCGKQEDHKNNKIHNKNEACSYCGKQGHGKNSPTKTRKNDCPKYGKTCAHCTRPNNLETVYHSKTKPNFKLPPSPNETENAVFDALCTARPKTDISYTWNTTYTTISMIAGSDNHLSLNHSSHSQQQPTQKTTGH